MSAYQSESDRDHEALKRAQRSHEASMDEILASIRAIIADDTANATTTAARPAPTPVPQVIYSNFGQAKTAAEALAQIPAKEPTSPAAVQTVVWPRPEEKQVGAAALSAALSAAPATASPVLLSEATERAVSQSFQALAASLALPGPERLEELARETLRPMVKVWLDENLPGLVERLVMAEIGRVARGGR